MAKLSKYYKVTNQILLEYITNQNPIEDSGGTHVNYTVYTGLDDNVYYTEKPSYINTDFEYYSDLAVASLLKGKEIDYSNSLYFIKFSDETNSDYNFLGFYKQILNSQRFINDKLIDFETLKDNNIINAYKSSNDTNNLMQYDYIRLHFIYGFMLDRLAGFTLQVKTNAKYYGPKQKIAGYNHLVFDELGFPVFQTLTVKTNDNAIAEIEPVIYNEKDITLLDIFFPKECLNFDHMLNWHKSPIYQNGCFYDRYIEIKVPSAYHLSLTNNITLQVNNPYGFSGKIGEYEPYDPTTYNSQDYIIYYLNGTGYKLPKFTDERFIFYYKNRNYGKLPQYVLPTTNPKSREITYTVLPDPLVIINFATVREENLTPIEDTITISESESEPESTNTLPIYYKSKFYQDPINQIALKYKSNSDYFNVRLYEDKENCEIIYYPTFGDSDNMQPLNYDIMAQIESGAISMITESFNDELDNMDSFIETYGENAFKWIIYNDISVTYIYGNIINSFNSQGDEIKFTQNFTNIIDYGIPDAADAGPFWINTFIPKIPERNNMVCKSINIAYTCRLINRLNSIEAIRTATLSIAGNDVSKYLNNKVLLKNVITYKIVNQVKHENVLLQSVAKESNDKYIRSYYDATNLVVKDMGTNNIYTQGQMTLYLKHTSTNYMLRLFTLNEDNVRVPFDLTGPYRYKLIFPSVNNKKIEIRPNTNSINLNLGIGQLVFYITEDQVRQIMNVDRTRRYFAIVTDTQNADQQQSTLYEGKVEYYG